MLVAATEEAGEESREAQEIVRGSCEKEVVRDIAPSLAEETGLCHLYASVCTGMNLHALNLMDHSSNACSNNVRMSHFSRHFSSRVIMWPLHVTKCFNAR